MLEWYMLVNFLVLQRLKMTLKNKQTNKQTKTKKKQKTKTNHFRVPSLLNNVQLFLSISLLLICYAFRLKLKLNFQIKYTAFD